MWSFQYLKLETNSDINYYSLRNLSNDSSFLVEYLNSSLFWCLYVL